MTLDEYMTSVQENFLKQVDLHKLGVSDVMFRAVDAAPLAPRWRVEVGLPTKRGNILLTTMKMKDPRVTARHLSDYVEQVVLPALEKAEA